MLANHHSLGAITILCSTNAYKQTDGKVKTMVQQISEML